MTASTSSADSRRGCRGFSLIELAVVIFIVALLLGSIMVPLKTQVESRNYDQTQRILDQAREALIGFAAANGRFPCPASLTSNGAEDGNAGTGACALSTIGPAVYAGFLPAVTLGFTPIDDGGYAVDAWKLAQNRIRYAVARVTLPAGNSNAFTKPGGMRTATMKGISDAALLYVCRSGTGVNAGTDCGSAANTLTSNAPVVIWSVGPNAATGGTSVDEAQNPNPSGGSLDRLFVSRTKSEGASGEFDDIVTWISTSALFSRLIAAGQLP
ncbi:MAG: type II secretion system protein [Gammaproteobacteria bacterium]|nr:type II secretion system protein [Gammaproteobacteria bacterium]